MSEGGFLRGADWKTEQMTLWAIVVLAVLVVLVVMSVPSTEQGRETRLLRFLSVIPEEAAEAFNATDYQAATEEIGTAYRRDLVFHEEFELLKDDELINHFTPAEVVGYFANNFTKEAMR